MTGHMAPSAMSGCCLSECFLETHTYIHIKTQRRGEKEKWAGYRFNKKEKKRKKIQDHYGTPPGNTN